MKPDLGLEVPEMSDFMTTLDTLRRSSWLATTLVLVALINPLRADGPALSSPTASPAKLGSAGGAVTFAVTAQDPSGMQSVRALVQFPDNATTIVSLARTSGTPA